MSASGIGHNNPPSDPASVLANRPDAGKLDYGALWRETAAKGHELGELFARARVKTFDIMKGIMLAA